MSVLRLARTARALSALVLVSVIASACTSLVAQRDEMVMGLDKTVGAGVQLSDRQVVVVTVTDAVHEQLSQGQSIRKADALPPLYARFMAELYSDFGLERVADWPLTSIEVRCLIFETGRTVSAKLLAEIQAHTFVETAQALNYFATSAAEQQYNDPYFELQTAHADLQVTPTHAWATGKGVVVAVIDTGLDTRHPDLAGRISGIRNFVARDTRSFRRDVHGTAVAGVIAANANNDIGIVGVAPEASILALKACDSTGASGDQARCNSFTLAKAIDFAIAKQADIINLSLAGPSDALLERLLERASARGAVVVGARSDNPEYVFPASAPGVVAVGVAGKLGANAVRAPGTNVVTTVPSNKYDFFSGSSFAAAYVSGIVALVRQRKPHVSAGVVRDLLQLTADERSGYTNACEALARIVSVDDCPVSKSQTSVADRID